MACLERNASTAAKGRACLRAGIPDPKTALPNEPGKQTHAPIKAVDGNAPSGEIPAEEMMMTPKNQSEEDASAARTRFFLDNAG